MKIKIRAAYLLTARTPSQQCEDPNLFFLLNSSATAYDGEPLSPHDKDSAVCLMQMFTVTCLAGHLLVACNQGQMIDDSKSLLNGPSSFYITCVRIDEKDAADIFKGTIEKRDHTKQDVEQHIGTAHSKLKRKYEKVKSNRGDKTKKGKNLFLFDLVTDFFATQMRFYVTEIS